MTACCKIDTAIVVTLASVLAGCGGNRATFTGGPQGTATFQPSYYILSVEYAPPGNQSGNAYYAAATTYGPITGIGSTFVGSPTLDYSGSGNTQGATTDLVGPSFAFSSISGLPQSFQVNYTNTLAKGDTASTAGAVTSSSDPVDHTQDVFFLWLNPQVVVSQTDASTGTYTLGTPSQGAQPEPMDVIDVSVAELLNPSLIPAAKLGSQTVNGVGGLPGLSSLCAQPAQCTASDFSTIVNFDPFSSSSVPSTEVPANVDPVRFVFINSTQLEGPDAQGDPDVVHLYWFTDTAVPPGSTEPLPYTVGLRAAPQTSGSFTLSLAQNNSLIWNNLVSNGPNTGHHQSQIILGSSTVGCLEDPDSYEDMLFHTFLFQQPSPPSLVCN
jgi:hypothetical protein